MDLFTDNKEELIEGFTANEVKVMSFVNKERYKQLMNSLVMKNFAVGNVVVDGYDENGILKYRWTKVSS